MAQTARPNSDYATNGEWTTETGSTTNCYASISESVLNSSTWIVSDGTGLGGDVTEYYLECGLTSLVDPVIHTGHTVTLYAYNFGGNIDMKCQWRRKSANAVIHEEFLSLNTTETFYTFTLTGPEAATILTAEYTNDLSLRFIRAGSATNRSVRVTQAYVQIPDAGFAHLDISTSGLVTVPAASGNYLIASGSGYRRIAGTEYPGSGALYLSGNGYKAG